MQGQVHPEKRLAEGWGQQGAALLEGVATVQRVVCRVYGTYPHIAVAAVMDTIELLIGL